MPITLNHTIVPSRDKVAAASVFRDGVQSRAWGSSRGSSGSRIRGQRDTWRPCR